MALAGSHMVTDVPAPSSLRIVILPPQDSTLCLAMARAEARTASFADFFPGDNPCQNAKTVGDSSQV